MVHENSVESDHGTRVPLEQLYLEHEPRVRWIMHARGVPEAWVDDLVHESFLAVSRRWPSRSPDVPVAVWIGGVARNIAFSHRRTEGRRRKGLSALPDRLADPPPDEVVAERRAWNQLERFAEGLSPKLREVFVLAELGGTPVPEIAAQSGTPVATIHSRLRLARSRFDAHFGDGSDSRRLLRAAARQRAPSEDQRRRSLAALLVAGRDLGVASSLPAAAAGVGGSTAVVWGTIAAVVLATVTTMVVVERALPPAVATRPRAPEPSEPVVEATAAPMPLPRRSPVPVATAPVATPPSAEVSRPSSPRRVGARPKPVVAEPTKLDPAGDPLAEHLAALGSARTQLQKGDYSGALATLDAVDARAPGLQRDHQRLLLRAACGAQEAKRVDAAAAALRRLGAGLGGGPCETPKNGGAK